MSSFMIFFLFSMVFWGALIYKAWQLNDDEKALISSQMQAIKQQSVERVQSLSLGATAPPPVDAEFAARFRAWGSDAAFIPDDLYRWMNGLSDEHFEVITEFVAQFCSDMGFDLRGVVDGVYTERALDDTLEQVVVHTLNAMQLVFGVRDDLLAYDTEQQPASPELTGHLQNLVANGKASVNGVLNRSGLAGGANGHLNGHSAD